MYIYICIYVNIYFVFIVETLSSEIVHASDFCTRVQMTGSFTIDNKILFGIPMPK